MPDLTSLMNKTSPPIFNRHVIKLPEQEQQQKLSYQTNKLAQYVELQLSDLENTLHYIQKKHSINQIKESISHAYSIFSQTQPVFRELRIVFIYDKIKKLVNCFSIIYLILMERIEKSSKIFLEPDMPKNNPDLSEAPIRDSEEGAITRKTQKGKNNYVQGSELQTITNGTKKPKPLGGVHLYNEQYNRHIESDLDRLKRKLKEQAKEAQQNNPKVSEKDKLKEEIFKEINTDIYGSPSPDQLTLFFNLNPNRYGFDLQYITFQDQLQEIATLFKQSQDQALEFLNKSRDDFIFLNINQGFKEIMAQYKVEKQEQVNGFVIKVKNLFEAIKIKTIQRQNEINLQIAQLKKIQKRITKPVCFEIETQTSFSYQDQISRLKKKIEEVQTNYKELQNYHSKENQNDSKNITFLEHKIAFKEHQITIFKKQLDQKNHFIEFLNEKINNGTDPKVLRKISNIYRSHSKKNSSKIKIQLQQLEKQVTIQQFELKLKGSLPSNEDDDQHMKRQNTEKQEEDQEEKAKQQKKKSMPMPFEDFKKPSKKKRKQGISFFASPQKRFTSYVERNASFNLQNTKIEEERSELQQASSGHMTMYEEQIQENNQKLGQTELSAKKDRQARNFVKPDKKKSQDRNSLQVMQKSKSKNFEPKISAFASEFGKTKIMQNSSSRFGIDKRARSMTNQNISEETIRQKMQEQELMRQINGMNNQNIEGLTDGEDENDFDYEQCDQDMERDEENINQDEIEEGQQNWENEGQNKLISLTKGGGKSEIGQLTKGKYVDGTKNLDNDTNSKFSNEIRNNSFLKPPNQETQGYRASPFRRKQRGIQSSPYEQNNEDINENLMGKNTKAPIRKNQLTSSNYNQNDLPKTSVHNRQKFSISNQQGEPTQQSDEYKIKKKRNKFQSQGLQENYDKVDSDFDDEDDQGSDVSDDGMTRFLKTFSGESNLDRLSAQQKDKMISTYFTSIYKGKKINSSNLCSRLIDISIGQDEAKPDPFQTKGINNNSVLLSQSGQDISKKNIVNTANEKTSISKVEELKSKSKQLSSGNLNELKKQRGKLSELGMRDSMMNLRVNHRMSQNINLHTNTLNTFNDIIVTPQVREQEDATQRQTKQVIQQASEPKGNSTEKKQQNSTDYDRIYGISMSSWNRNKRYNTDLSSMNEKDKQKMEEYLEKAAIKAAMKSKNVEQFKAKIKKMHFSKCGQKCKHLERYLQNFNKYRSCNREIMKIHIENVHTLIPSEPMTRSNKENSVTLPSINIVGPADSSKDFGSIQRNHAAVNKK